MDRSMSVKKNCSLEFIEGKRKILKLNTNWWIVFNNYELERQFRDKKPNFLVEKRWLQKINFQSQSLLETTMSQCHRLELDICFSRKKSAWTSAKNPSTSLSSPFWVVVIVNNQERKRIWYCQALWKKNCEIHRLIRVYSANATIPHSSMENVVWMFMKKAI